MDFVRTMAFATALVVVVLAAVSAISYYDSRHRKLQQENQNSQQLLEQQEALINQQKQELANQQKIVTDPPWWPQLNQNLVDIRNTNADLQTQISDLKSKIDLSAAAADLASCRGLPAFGPDPATRGLDKELIFDELMARPQLPPLRSVLPPPVEQTYVPPPRFTPPGYPAPAAYLRPTVPNSAVNRSLVQATPLAYPPLPRNEWEDHWQQMEKEPPLPQ